MTRRHWLFGLVLACAVALRVLAMLAFRPIMWFGGDSASYLATGLRLIPDPSRVGGYGFMLWVLRPLHSLALVAAVQHLMGIVIGVLIYLLARRHGLPAWVATLAAIPVLFDAYELQLEADAVPDIPFGLLVMIALYLLLRSPGERRLACVVPAAFLLGVSAILWPVGLALLAILLAVLLAGLVIRRAGLLAVAAAILAGAVPVAGYAAWFDLHEHQFSLTRSDGVFLWSRTMSFANCAVIRPPADERTLCPPGGPRIASSLYIWSGASPLLRMPGGRFSARTNALALDFALRAIAAQPGGYATAVGHDFALSFAWNRPVHPDAGIVDRYQFSDATTAWVPATMRTPGGGTVAGDQAAYDAGLARADARGPAVRLVAGELPALRVPAGDAARGDPARRPGGDDRAAPGAGRPSVGVRGDDPARAAPDRRLRPALPGARGARCVPGRGPRVRPPAVTGGSAQVEDVAGRHREHGAGRGADQQPAVRVHADGQPGEHLTAGEFGPDTAADRAGQLGVPGPQPAAIGVAAGPAPGLVPALEAAQDRDEQRFPC